MQRFMGGFTELLKHMLLQALVVTQGLERLLNKSTHISIDSFTCIQPVC